MLRLEGHMRWPRGFVLAGHPRRPESKDIEIGLGATVWVCPIFMVVHFGGATG